MILRMGSNKSEISKKELRLIPEGRQKRMMGKVVMKKNSVLWALLSGILVLLGVALVVFYSTKAWQVFLTFCPNHDFLSWDENIRLNTVLDQFTDFRDGHIFYGTLPFFESPTWPPLRSLMTFVTLYLPLETPVTFRDSFLGLLFLVLVYPALLFASFKITKSFLLASLLSFLIFLLTIQTGEVPAYSLSSMLETQSMFFLLLSVYAVYRLYDEVNQLTQSNSVSIFNVEIETSTKWMLSFSLLGFYFTKYPYGILFFMACMAYEFVRHSKEYVSALRSLFKTYVRGIRLIYLLFVVLMVFSLPVLRLFSQINLNQKSFKQFMFGITFLLFVDISIYFFRNRNEMVKIFPKTVVILWKFVFFPAFLWLFINPDRVNALIDAQMIVNAYTRSFFLTLWTEPGLNPAIPGIFDFIWGFRALVIFSLVSFLYFLIRPGVRFLDKIKDPLFAGSFVLVLELFILEITTGNKQPRHVLQFIPAMGLLFFLWIFKLNEFAKTKLERIAAICAFFLTLLFVLANGFYDQGIFSNDFFEKKMFCYRGINQGDFEPAREIASQVQADKKYILLNAFHHQEKYESKGRVLASDFDLALKLKTYKTGMVRNDNKYRWKDWSRFDSVLLLSDTCPDPFIEEKFEARSKFLNVKTKLTRTFRESSNSACLLEYEVLKE